MSLCLCVFFFFKQKTAYEMRISDWSSDVCSSDLHKLGLVDPVHRVSQRRFAGFLWQDTAELIAPRPEDAMILQRAQRHGIYDGLTVPAHLPGEAHGSVSFAWDADGMARDRKSTRLNSSH